MTVPAGQVPIINYSYAGPGDYDFSFRVFGEEDVQVVHQDETGLQTVLQLHASDGYTVTLEATEDAPGQKGGTCHVLWPATSGGLMIRRDMLVEQPTDWVNNNPFNAELLETNLDRAIMLIQEMQLIVEGDYTPISWRGPWVEYTGYDVSDLVTADNGNIYIAMVSHTSTGDFDTDLAAGNWLLILDVAYAESLVELAAQSEANAKASETAAAASEAQSLISEERSAASEVNASLSENGAANCAAAGYQSALAAEAAKDAAESIVAVGERIDSVGTDFYAATAAQTQFVVNYPSPSSNVLVFMNSRKLRVGEDYSVDNTSVVTLITLLTPADAGDEIEILSLNAALVGETCASHAIASHNDTSATGANLNELVGQGSTNLHTHNQLKTTAGYVSAFVQDSDSRLYTEKGFVSRSPITGKVVLIEGGNITSWGDTILTGAYERMTDPHVAGQVWNDNGILTFSAG